METEMLNESNDFESLFENVYVLLYSNWLLDSISEIIFWKHPVVTGSILAIVVSLFLMIKIFSLISFIVLIGFVFITLPFILLLYSSIRQIKNPLEQYVEDVIKFISIQITDKTSTLNKAVTNLSDIFSFNNYMSSLKFFFLSFAIFYIGKYCDFNTVLETIAFLLVVPQSLCLLISSIYKIINMISKDNGEHQINNCETNTIQTEGVTKSKDINILLLGESGVGKSTWINGFVNYVSYDSLEEAERGAPVSVIPAMFTVRDSDFKEHKIVYGIDDDRNEFTEKVGESVTQMPKSYLFNIDDVSIRIIDTPGIGDTRGTEQDKRNMQNILDHLAKCKHLNGIIVLLKPTNSRLTSMFEYCIKELLRQLHKDACKNIVICFIHARGTDYRPGETMAILEELLRNNEDIDIKLNKHTVYCMDNEAVRYLMAMKYNIFNEENKINSAQSWKNAVEELKRMISYISSLEPHAIQNTLSINEVRRAITELSRPVADILKTIQMNIAEIKKKDNEKVDVNKNKEDLLKQLEIPSTSLKNIRLDHPRTVCTASKCNVSFDGGASHIRYKTICDSQCTEISTVENVTGSEGIKQCKSMARGWIWFWTFTCKQCGCDWSTHMHITYEVVQETVMIIDTNVKDKIDEKDGAIRAIEEHKKQLKDRLNQYRHEQKRLLEISAHFACFLKHNEIIPSNDPLIDQLDLLTGNKPVKGSDIDAKTKEGLIEWKKDYENQIILIENRLKEDPDVINLENINKLMMELKELPNVGQMLKDALAVVKEANEASRKVTEKVINVSTTKWLKLGTMSFLFLKNKLAINKE